MNSLYTAFRYQYIFASVSSTPTLSNFPGGGGENYVPEDLISLLDAGINSDHPSVIIDADAMFSEEMFSSYSGQQRAALARSSSSRYLDTILHWRNS